MLTASRRNDGHYELVSCDERTYACIEYKHTYIHKTCAHIHTTHTCIHTYKSTHCTHAHISQSQLILRFGRAASGGALALELPRATRETKHVAERGRERGQRSIRRRRLMWWQLIWFTEKERPSEGQMFTNISCVGQRIHVLTYEQLVVEVKQKVLWGGYD